MQGVTRNPLVSPFTIGVSSAAAFGASLAIFAGASLSTNGGIAVVASAFACSMLCVLVVFGLARVKRAAPETVILAGIAISYLFAALTAVIQFFADQQQLQAMVHWTFGTLNATRWSEIWPVAPVLALVLPVLVKTAWDLNVMMEAGDEVAKTLGIDVRRVRGKALLLGTLLASTITCFTGIIAFVGLVAPHITRFLVGADNRYVLPGAATVGATLVVLADSVGRTVLAPVQLPIGIVISFVGVPVFLYLLMHRGATAWQ